jgi:predicted  nucleic acid-binding Zn-ribbon protein
MSQTLSLYRLQQADSQIDRAQARLEAIQKALDNDNELLLANERVDTTRITCQSAESALKQAEVNAHNQRIKIDQIQVSLYSGKGHSPKELLDLQNDVAALKRHLITLEDIQLDAMMAAEETMSAHQAAQGQLQDTKDYSIEKNRGLHEEQNMLQKELEKLFSERAAISGSIPPNDLDLYDKLRLQRRGFAVAVISDNSCSACGSGLSAAQIQSSRASEQLALCPSCGRILYGS